MRKTLAVALNDLRIIFADGSIWVNLVLVPVVLALVIGVGIGALFESSDGDQVIPVDLFDADQSDLSRNLVAEMVRANPRLLICPAGGSATLDPDCNSGGATIAVDQLQRRLESEQSDAYIVIPQGFGASVMQGEPLPVVYRSRESALAPSVRFAALEAATSGASTGATARRVTQRLGAELPLFATLPLAEQESILAGARAIAQSRLAASPFVVESIALFDQDEGAEATDGIHVGLAQSIPGMGSMYAVIATLAMAAAWVRDRKQGVIQRALTMAVQPAQLMGGKVLAYFTIGLIQLTLLFVFGALFGLRYGSNVLALATLMIAFTFAATGLALFVTSLVSTDSQAQSIGLLVGLVMGPLGGAWWTLQIVPRWMQIVGHATPIAWAMDGYQALIYRDAGWGGVWLPIAVLLGMATLFFTLALWRIRVREA